MYYRASRVTVFSLAFYFAGLLISLNLSAAFASPYMSLAPSSTGENISVTEDGNGWIDVISCNLVDGMAA